jgi:hypothetical protein
MQKLDRLGWAAGFSFAAYGVQIGVRTNQLEMLEVIKKLLPFGWKPTTVTTVDRLFSLKVGGTGKRRGLRQFHLLYDNFLQLLRTHDLEEALQTLEFKLQLHIAEQARRRVFVHAGVVGWQGQAILIPGKSLSGKSTLVREFLKAGAQYYSDEYAVLDTKGRVHPYPLPIGVRKHSLQKQDKVPIESFGGVVGKKPLPVGTVLVTNFKQGACWRPKLIPAGKSLLALLSNTVSAQRNPAKALATLENVVLKAQSLQSVRGEASEVMEDLLVRL